MQCSVCSSAVLTRLYILLVTAHQQEQAVPLMFDSNSNTASFEQCSMYPNPAYNGYVPQQLPPVTLDAYGTQQVYMQQPPMQQQQLSPVQQAPLAPPTFAVQSPAPVPAPAKPVSDYSTKHFNAAKPHQRQPHRQPVQVRTVTSSAFHPV
jgi:hypothetical protein